MKTILNILLAPLFALLIATQANASKYNDQKVVYHMNYGDTHRIEETMVNISNHISEVGEERIDLKVVVHGKAIEYFRDAVKSEAKQMTLDSLRLRDVQFIICGNSLDGYKITYKDLYDVDASDVVKAGLPEIVHLQQQGYLYVRP